MSSPRIHISDLLSLVSILPTEAHEEAFEFLWDAVRLYATKEKPVTATAEMFDRFVRIKDQLGMGTDVAATRKEAVAPTCVANDSPVSVPSTYWSEEAGILTSATTWPVKNGRIEIAFIPEKLAEVIRLHRFACEITRWREKVLEQKGDELVDFLDLADLVRAFTSTEVQP